MQNYRIPFYLVNKIVRPVSEVLRVEINHDMSHMYVYIV